MTVVKTDHIVIILFFFFQFQIASRSKQIQFNMGYLTKVKSAISTLWSKTIFICLTWFSKDEVAFFTIFSLEQHVYVTLEA